MSPEELYAFDLNGYLVVENAIDPQLLSDAQARAAIWEARAKLTRPGQAPEPGEAPRRACRFDRIVNDDETFLHVALSPQVLARIVDLVVLPRLKSTWLDFKAQGGGIGFHSNHTPYNPVEAYIFQQRVCASLVTVCYALNDVPLDGGALEVVPGSHKANLPMPADERAVEPLRRRLPLKAGSALIFSHDMNHGSTNRLPYVRRCLFASFATGSSAHTQGDNDLYDAAFARMPEGSWLKYFLRRPKGDRDSYPMPKRTVAEEFGLEPADVCEASV